MGEGGTYATITVILIKYSPYYHRLVRQGGSRPRRQLRKFPLRGDRIGCSAGVIGLYHVLPGVTSSQPVLDDAAKQVYR